MLHKSSLQKCVRGDRRLHGGWEKFTVGARHCKLWLNVKVCQKIFDILVTLVRRNNLNKYRKGFEVYIRRRDRLSKIITDIATDLEMMKHVRLVQNKDIKRRVKNLMQKIIDGLFIDPKTIQIDQRELKYENVYNG